MAEQALEPGFPSSYLTLFSLNLLGENEDYPMDSLGFRFD